jgi:hypothetical protein
VYPRRFKPGAKPAHHWIRKQQHQVRRIRLTSTMLIASRRPNAPRSRCRVDSGSVRQIDQDPLSDMKVHS